MEEKYWRADYDCGRGEYMKRVYPIDGEQRV